MPFGDLWVDSPVYERHGTWGSSRQLSEASRQRRGSLRQATGVIAPKEGVITPSNRGHRAKGGVITPMPINVNGARWWRIRPFERQWMPMKRGHCATQQGIAPLNWRDGSKPPYPAAAIQCMLRIAPRSYRLTRDAF